jgi:hypothetical protein
MGLHSSEHTTRYRREAQGRALSIIGDNLTDLPDELRHYIENECSRIYWLALKGSYSILR